MPTRFFVHDKSRQCQAVMGAQLAEEALRDGFREVSAAELNEFQSGTEALKAKKRKKV